jgi:hypothetical protein
VSYSSGLLDLERVAMAVKECQPLAGHIVMQTQTSQLTRFNRKTGSSSNARGTPDETLAWLGRPVGTSQRGDLVACRKMISKAEPRPDWEPNSWRAVA